MSRLTDEELHEVEKDNSAKFGDAYLTANEAVSMASELRERRAADLTDEERDLLAAVLNNIVRVHPLPDPPCSCEGCERHRQGIALLTRLATKEPAVLDKLLAREVSK